jgi:hypothetical protein
MINVRPFVLAFFATVAILRAVSFKLKPRQSRGAVGRFVNGGNFSLVSAGI